MEGETEAEREDFSERRVVFPAGTEMAGRISGWYCEGEGRDVRDVRDGCWRGTGEEQIQTCGRWAGRRMLKVVPAVCSSAVPSLGWPSPRRRRRQSWVVWAEETPGGWLVWVLV